MEINVVIVVIYCCTHIVTMTTSTLCWEGQSLYQNLYLHNSNNNASYFISMLSQSYGHFVYSFDFNLHLIWHCLWLQLTTFYHISTLTLSKLHPPLFWISTYISSKLHPCLMWTPNKLHLNFAHASSALDSTYIHLTSTHTSSKLRHLHSTHALSSLYPRAIVTPPTAFLHVALWWCLFQVFNIFSH